jgi:molecular chaperone DnaK
MVQDAEANAEADKKARELVESRNAAESQLHTIKKDLAEHGTKITEDEKTKIDEAIKSLEEAIAGNDIEKINESIGKLYEPVAPLYTAKQAAEAEIQPGAEPNSENPADVVDADFTEVKKDA